MSSRLTPPQPNPKHLPYPTAPAVRNHAMAATPFPPPGPHVLPPSSVLAESAIKLERPTHLQPAYGLRSPPLKLEPLDFSNSYRPVTSSQHPSPILPPPRRSSYQGAAPLGQLLHPAPSHRWDPTSPSSSYSPPGSERSSYGGASFRAAPPTSPTEYGSWRGTPSASNNYTPHPGSAGPYRYVSTAFDARPVASMHAPRAAEPAPKAPDM